MSKPTQFTTLPAELRLKIYALAFPSPSVIHIKNWRTDPWNSMIKGFFAASPTTTLSPLLSLSQESRSEFLHAHHKLCTPFDIVTEAPVFFNLGRDILLLDLSWVSFQIGHPCMELLAPREVLVSVRRIAMDFVTEDGGGLGYLLMRNPLKLFEYLGLFAGLEEFIFIFGRETGEESRIELVDVELKSDMMEIGEKVLERIGNAFRECEGHCLKRLPRIRFQTVRGSEKKIGGTVCRLCRVF